MASSLGGKSFLATLGQELYRWLNGPNQFLNRLLNAAPLPLLVEFAVDKSDDSPSARVFLDAPWELLASDGQHWALREDIVFCPVRRIGKALPPPGPALHRLSLVFMAAAPRGADNLSYEAEEASILRATRDLGLDLVVEESGTLHLLSACVAREKPDAVQISCHGTLTPEPGLLLEDDLGNHAFVKASELVRKLAAHHPRLLFLSACETAEANPVLNSLARSLVRSGTPSVMGWAAPVLDHEATLFAASFYARLTAGEDLSHALAYARLDLAQSEELPEPDQPGPRACDWHLTRLYLSLGGGGCLATADGPRRLVSQGQAVKTFLDTKGKKVSVASELEFVGRRREIQRILHEFRAPRSERSAGVFVHGLGRQGKSSLAARVAHRLEPTHELIVLYGRYDGPALLGAFRDRLATPAVTDLINHHLPLVEQQASNLLPALTELLEGPCRQERKDADGRPIARPILLVIDDFEKALEEKPAGPRHTLKPAFIEPMRAVIMAFGNADTDSRLLFTSRYQFTLPEVSTDLAERLFELPLRRMDPHEARKQATAKFRLQADGAKHGVKNQANLLARMDRIIAAGQGNPGLQDLLFALCLDNPLAGDRCLEQMEEYQETGTLPEAEEVRQFLENLAISALLDLLEPAQRELLRSSNIFALPVPVPVIEALADAVWGKAAEPTHTGPGGNRSENLRSSAAIGRLVALGLWEVYEDMFDPQAPSLAVHALVRPQAGNLSEDEQQVLASAVNVPLFEHWGGEIEGRKRSLLQDYELTRLALLAREPRVLAATAADALRFLANQFSYRQAATWAVTAIEILDAAQVAVSVDLLRTAAERCQQVGNIGEANTLRDRALARIAAAQGKGEKVDTVQHAATLITHARALVEQGLPDEAIRHLEQAQALLPPGREQAIVLGDIARIRAAKGEVDAELQLHQERLGIFEALGDLDGIANTLWSIAQIEIRQQKWQEAFDHLSLSY